MPTVNAVLRKSKVNSKGTAPIYLRLSDARSDRFISLRLRIRPSQWNERQGRVRKSHPNADELNALIATRLAEAEGEVIQAKREGGEPTASVLKSALVSTPKEDADFIGYAIGQADMLDAEGRAYTAKKWRSITGKLQRFVAGTKPADSRTVKPATTTLPFSEMTPDLLGRFEAHLRAPKPKGWGNAPNSVRHTMRAIKIIYNRAIKDETAPEGHNPFGKYGLPKGTKPERHKLTLDEVRRMESLDLPLGGYLWHARNYFMFAFYAGGIRFGDVAKLRRSALHMTDSKTYLRYKQSKTGSPMSTQLVPPALAILDRYPQEERPRSPFVFPILDGADGADAKEILRRVSAANALTNKALKRIAHLSEIEEKVSFHISRHSFADLARRSGWDLPTIMSATGHRSLGSLQAYLKGFDQERLDESMSSLFGGCDE